MTIYDLKPSFQNLLRPICRRLAKAGITPNQVTIVAFILSVVTGAVIWTQRGVRWTLFLVPVVLFVRMALNAIDGMLAREHDMKTPLGAILNELGDVLADSALYLPLVVIPAMPATLLVLAVLLAVVSEMTGVVAVQIGAQRRYDGPMGKSDRAFVFSVLSVVVACGVPGGDWLTVVMAIVVVLLVVTICNRARNALKEVRA